MNCLLMREISVQNTIRMWDTYLVSLLKNTLIEFVLMFMFFSKAEGPDAFSQFHLYVCSAFLVRWSEKLRQMDFQVSFPTHEFRFSIAYPCATRALLCSFNHYRLKTGVIMKSKCFSVKLSYLIQSGRTPRAISVPNNLCSVLSDVRGVSQWMENWTKPDYRPLRARNQM